MVRDITKKVVDVSYTQKNIYGMTDELKVAVRMVADDIVNYCEN